MMDAELIGLIIMAPLAWLGLGYAVWRMSRPQPEEMTQEEWDEMRLDLDRHLTEVEESFWKSVRIGGR